MGDVACGATPMNDLSFKHRLAILLGVFALSVAGLLFVDPIPQDPAYHRFADARSCLGMANCGDVLSNVGFAAAGFLGLWFLIGRRGAKVFADRAEARPYVVFFAAIVMVGLGSAYYHGAPGNDRLFWDRLPMTVAFMALFAAIIADRLGGGRGDGLGDGLGDGVGGGKGTGWLLPLLVMLGVLSLVYWDWTEAAGRGDLRFYGLVQFYPLAAIPLICWLFPAARYSRGGGLVLVVMWYALAKLLEHFDAPIFDLLGGTVSGHSLKHLASAVAAWAALRMVLRGTRTP